MAEERISRMDIKAGACQTEWINIQNLLGQQFCPECGKPMKAADWLKQKDIVFVWYRCSRLHCKGSHLQKLVKKP